MRFTIISGVAVAFPLLALAQGQPNSAPNKQAQTSRWQSGQFTSIRDSVDIFGPPALLGSPIIAEALDLSEKQRKGIVEMRQSVHKTRAKAVIQAFGPDDEFDREKMAIVEASLRSEQQASLARILTRAQFKRYWEIALQLEGLRAANWPEVQEALNMSPEQRLAVKEVYDGHMENCSHIKDARHELFKNFNVSLSKRRANGEILTREQILMENKKFFETNSPFFDRAYAAWEANRVETERKIARILTRRQVQLFLKNQGKPIDVTELIKPGGGYYRPDEYKKYEENRLAKKAQAK